MTQRELQEIVNGAISKYLNDTGLVAKLDLLKKIQEGVATSLQIIESDPHQWSKRPCRSCKMITDLIDRPFGCYNTALRR